jgi:hypothetical protein
MDNIIEKSRLIAETKEVAMQCGGTYSSHNLQICLSLLKELEAHQDHQKYKRVLSSLLLIKDNWQSALINHNSSSYHFIKYDIETGLPLKSE